MTGVLHLVSAPLGCEVLARLTGQRAGVGGTDDEGMALHHLLSETFGKGAVQPFRFLVAPRARSGTLYGYSALGQDALCEAARTFGMPEHITVLDPAGLRTKPMPGTWTHGQRLGFDVRLRPTRRVKSDTGGRFRPGSERDAFLHEALRDHGDDPDGMRRAGRDREAVYLDWLAERLAPAAVLDAGHSRLARFRRLRVVRDGRALEGPDAVVHGVLTVSDPDAFAGLLARGVGRHCAYGYGMLLLRPPQAPVPGR